MGKLGGNEIGYGSDLDVLFIFDPEAVPAEHDPYEYFTRRAQRVIRLVSLQHPEGPGYELDTRLRPSGSHGLLVTSLEAFARYHDVKLAGKDAEAMPSVVSSGAAWERQALVRRAFPRVIASSAPRSCGSHMSPHTNGGRPLRPSCIVRACACRKSSRWSGPAGTT